MYSNDSNLKNINIISKFIGLMFALASIIINNNQYIFMLFAIIFIIIDKINVRNIILLIGSIINCFFNIDLAIKIIFIYNYLQMFINIITFNELKYFLEELLYKRHSKILKIMIAILYFIKNAKSNYKEMLVLLKSYGLKLNINNIKFILKETFIKSKKETIRIMQVYKYRFYNIYNKKTYYDKDEIDSYDFKYILVYVIIFLLIYIVRGYYEI